MSNINTLAAFLYLHNVVPEELCQSWAEKIHPAFEDLMERLTQLPDRTSDVDVQTVFYDVGKQYAGAEKDSLRLFFRILYTIICRRYSGPRWGIFVNMIGRDDFVWMAQQNYQNLFHLSILDRDTSHCYEGEEDVNLL